MAGHYNCGIQSVQSQQDEFEQAKVGFTKAIEYADDQIT